MNLTDPWAAGYVWGKYYALYGRSWKSAMAEDLHVDARRITHWLQGTRPVPAGVWLDLQKIAGQRLADVQEAAAGLL